MTKIELRRYKKRRKRILGLYIGGKMPATIARMMGMTRQRVWQILHGK